MPTSSSSQVFSWSTGCQEKGSCSNSVYLAAFGAIAQRDIENWQARGSQAPAEVALEFYELRAKRWRYVRKKELSIAVARS